MSRSIEFTSASLGSSPLRANPWIRDSNLPHEDAHSSTIRLGRGDTYPVEGVYGGDSNAHSSPVAAVVRDSARVVAEIVVRVGIGSI